MYFLDVPWQLIAPERSFIQNGDIIHNLIAALPWVPLERTFALVPEEVMPAVCRGARELRELLLGAIDSNGSFVGEITCPPYKIY